MSQIGKCESVGEQKIVETDPFRETAKHSITPYIHVPFPGGAEWCMICDMTSFWRTAAVSRKLSIPIETRQAIDSWRASAKLTIHAKKLSSTHSTEPVKLHSPYHRDCVPNVRRALIGIIIASSCESVCGGRSDCGRVRDVAVA